jgi:putative glutamine amidotransferase
MKSPLIGIGCDVAPVSSEEPRERVYIWASYLEAVAGAGGAPVLIPFHASDLERVVASLDGLILAGGDDLSPDSYGDEPRACGAILDPRRQRNDLALARMARGRSLPLLGICLGSQVMNVAAGGTLVQDIPSEVEGALEHKGSPGNRKRHVVEVAPESMLASILGTSSVGVNSGHHQSVREVGDGLRVVARSSDGVVEAVEDARHSFYLGVQWHPEEMLGEESAKRLFEAFVGAARRGAAAKLS